MEMINVLKKLQEIQERSPDEIGRALDSISKLNPEPVAEAVQVNLSGADAVLGQILTLAGMINAETNMTMQSSEPVAPVVSAAPGPVSSEPSLNPMDDQASITMDDLNKPEDRPYTNSPNEYTKPLKAAVPSGNDVARPKATYPKVAGGDNPTHVAVSFD